MRIGVLALQGAFARHIEVLDRLGAEAVKVRQPHHLDGLDGLVIPGGESTTMGKLMRSFDLVEPVAKLLADEVPVFGTCAGMILLASDVSDGAADQLVLGAIDLGVRRNGYGRQIDSFEAPLIIDGIDGGPLTGVFIRAPVVERVGDGVEVLATVDGVAVLCRHGGVLVSSFHPELTGDDRLHELFLTALR